jgi:D-sedoheptulose 7-phosphate isomerase
MEFTNKINLFLDLLSNLEEEIFEQAQQIAQKLTFILENKGTIYVMGNGGSCSQSSHFVAELVGRLERDRFPIAAVDLCSSVSVITCIANDFGYDKIFARQISALASPKDCIVALSTSGNSRNVYAGLKNAKENNVFTIGLLGRDGGIASSMCDLACIVPLQKSANIQEIHLILIHLICEFIEVTIVKPNSRSHG